MLEAGSEMNSGVLALSPDLSFALHDLGQITSSSRPHFSHL